MDGQPVTVYNSPAANGLNDIFLFSTTCDGTVRWSQAIGEETDDVAYNLALDSNDNVYVGATVNGSSTYSVFFSPTDSITPFPANPDAYKPIHLVKYNNNEQYQGRKALQGNVTGITDGWSQILDLFIDSNDTIHFIVGLLNGTHLDGNVTVPAQYMYDPATFTYTIQYHLVKYDTDLDYISSMELPISTDSGYSISTTRFTYDDNLNRYYIAGMRSNNLSAELIPLTYDNKAFVKRSFILAIDGTDGSEVWRREVYSEPVVVGKPANNSITSIIVDTNSDVYIGGNIWRTVNEQNLKIYDPTDSLNTTYTFTLGVPWNMPIAAKLNSNGAVQWVQTPAAYNTKVVTTGLHLGKGLAIRNNEVVFGAQGANVFWDGIETDRPQFHQPDPFFIRINKQTGAVIAVHDIEGSGGNSQQATAIAVDNDGNYVVGGSFSGLLFENDNNMTIAGNGFCEFFVAKLAASECGTTVSTEEFNKLQVNVYPNPTSDIVNIDTEEALQSYEVYNVLGQQVQNGMFTGSSQVNLHVAATGTYFIKLTTVQGSSATVKVVKK